MNNNCFIDVPITMTLKVGNETDALIALKELTSAWIHIKSKLDNVKLESITTNNKDVKYYVIHYKYLDI